MLVVIFIILLVSVVALPTVLPALQHRQVSEAGRILQGALVGARDRAIHDGQPSGIRLLPDPAFNGINPTTGQLDPAYPLAFNRAIPIGPAPDYQEGMVNLFPPSTYAANFTTAQLATIRTVTTPQGTAWAGCPALILEQSVQDPSTKAPNSPTSWYWNVRLGDKVQLNNGGPWYTVAGPMATVNPEMFVNLGPPGSSLPVLAGGVACEYLLLVNGQDDNGNGWADEGFDGVDNDGDGLLDESTCSISTSGEWEPEMWLGSAGAGLTNIPYTIARRPSPAPNAREIALPTAMVIDATTWGNANPERSRLPIESTTGAVDVMVNPDGTAYFASMYGVPTRYGLGAVFYHFWLAERQDVQPPSTAATAPPYLPIGQITSDFGVNQTAYSGPTLKGEFAILSLNARTGRLLASDNATFDNPNLPVVQFFPVPPPPTPPPPIVYNPSYPFLINIRGISSMP